MLDTELRRELDDIKKILSDIKDEVDDKGHFLIIIMLFITMVNSCDIAGKLT